ncbi:MAG: DUF6485 family protein [Candidatus Omnitrophica bacterium]|nr:DUF6485 family protein [Candidatus Omnitrophota bacterium]
MECKKTQNIKVCNCSYESCDRRGVCCECVAYHRKRKELPACYFSTDTEKTWDRSIENFIRNYKA